MSEVIKGSGFAAANLDDMGEGFGFRKIRKALDVKELGVNAIVIPPSYETGRHFHDEQEELYLVHRGRIEIGVGEGDDSFVLEEGGVARIDAPTWRKIKNLSDSEEAVYVVVGAKGGYVGRDGRLPEGENRFGSAGAPPGSDSQDATG